MKKLVVVFFSYGVFAGFIQLEDRYDYHLRDEIKVRHSASKKIVKKKRSSEIDKLLKKIEDNDKSINTLLEANEKRIIVRQSEERLKSLTRIRGTLLNSTVATNRKTTTLVVKAGENEYFDSAEIRCQGLSFGKRVQAKCDLVVTDEKEYRVEAELWDIDGAEGIIADEFYDGSEKEFLISSFASFFEGILSGTKDRLITPYGEVERGNAKNQVLSGLVGVASNASSKIKESSEKNLQIALINSGKEVYIFFQKGLTL